MAVVTVFVKNLKGSVRNDLPGGMDAKHPLRVRVREIERYNRENGTSYTYGQFESLVNCRNIKI